MSRILLPFLAAGLLLSGAASAASFTATTDVVVGGLINTVDATSDLTSSLRDDKLVLDARDDAARFVASRGDLRGAHLEGGAAAHSQPAAAIAGQRSAAGRGDTRPLTSPAADAAETCGCNRVLALEQAFR